MTLTAAIIKAVAPKAKPAIVDAMVALSGEIERATGDKVGLAHFLAQCAKESDGFRVTEEYATGQAYEGRRDLGNVSAGDGRRFKGRGILQVTGRANYKRVGDQLGIDAVGNPELLSEPRIAVQSALVWWAANNMRSLTVDTAADTVKRVTKRVNGGYNGLTDRREYFSRATSALNLEAKGTPASRSKTVGAALGISGITMVEVASQVVATREAVDATADVAERFGFDPLRVVLALAIIGLASLIVYERVMKSRREKV